MAEEARTATNLLQKRPEHRPTLVDRDLDEPNRLLLAASRQRTGSGSSDVRYPGGVAEGGDDIALVADRDERETGVLLISPLLRPVTDSRC